MIDRVLQLGVAVAALAALPGCATNEQMATEAVPPAAPQYDVVIKNGMIYDGTGGKPYVGSVAIKDDKIVAVGRVDGTGKKEIDAAGQAVAPGFINMLSWATESLIQDGRGLSDLKQGVTLEVFGEGWTMGPLTPAMKQDAESRQGDIRYPVAWTTLGEYLEFLENKGVSPNIASFVGATTIRMHELGEADVDPTPEQIETMRGLVRQAMKEGAMGVGSALIYAPGNYAETPELVALAAAAGQCGGRYISHMRSEADDIGKAIDEVLMIAREGNVPAEIYHLKLAGKDNWDRLPEIIGKIETARAEGVKISANMYVYTAGGTGLDAVIPPWAHDGGKDAFLARLRDPETRARILREMREPSGDWENLLRLSGGAENVMLVSFGTDALKPLAGKTLADVAAMRGKSAEETAIELVLEDEAQVGAMYFMISEDNIRKQTAIPWVSFGSDAEAAAAEGVFLESGTHPRAYGNFARVLGKYVREEKALTLPAAIRKLTLLPATNLGLRGRGSLAAGNYGDVVIFDPAKIADRATYVQPQQYATGVRDVFVNGVQVLANGEHTGATPGRVVRGPGWSGWPDGGACRDGLTPAAS